MSKKNSPPQPEPKNDPAPQGNPAYPDLKNREKTVKANTGKYETVQKLPAAKLDKDDAAVTPPKEDKKP